MSQDIHKLINETMKVDASMFPPEARRLMNEGRMKFSVRKDESGKFFLKLEDGRTSALTDEPGVTQELRKLNLDDRDIETAVAQLNKTGFHNMFVDSEILRKSGVSFK